LSSETLAPDPRISHTLNLKIDEYGNVLKSVAIAYPRVGRHGDDTLPTEAVELIEQVQQERHLVFSQNTFTNDEIADDSYRLRLPSEAITYELTGIEPEGDFYYSLQDLRDADIARSVPEIGYHITPSRSTPQRRQVERVRMLYFSDDLATPLSWGVLNSLALPYETYKLALTDELLEAVFKTGQLTSEVRESLNTADLNGYLSGDVLDEQFLELDTEGQYWVRSGVAGFATDAAAHFYLPERYINPFGEATTLTYDGRDLYVASSEDAVGNVTRVMRFDFRVMAPLEMQDINNNRSQVYVDVLGLPTAMAVLLWISAMRASMVTPKSNQNA